MKKLFFVISLFIISSVSLFAQSAAKSVYAEIGGPGIASVNFDTRFTKQEAGLGGRIGIGAVASGGIGVVAVPVGLTYLLGKDNKNYFELGAGATYISASSVFDDGGDDHASTVFGHVSVGYRLQPASSGFLFRAAIVPIFGKGFFFPYWAGVAFGYKF